MFRKEAVTENGSEALVFIIVWRKIRVAGTSGEEFLPFITSIVG